MVTFLPWFYCHFKFQVLFSSEEDLPTIFIYLFFSLKERVSLYLRLNFQEKDLMHQFFLQFQLSRILSWYDFKSQGLSFP